jgi:hypothetical protein
MNTCVIITSVIETSKYPLSYSNVRSIYSAEQRFQQTLETIESVRRYIPTADILLVECSPTSKYTNAISEKVDYFLNLEFNEIVNNGLAKGKGEVTLLLYALDNIPKKYTYIYKITGRYVLQPTFNISHWNLSGAIVGCKTDIYGMSNSIHTFFYRIDTRYMSLYRDFLLKYMDQDNNVCIENFLASTIKPIQYINHIGILVRWACYTDTPIY